MVLRADQGPAAARGVHLPADLADKITAFAIRYNRTARPWTWSYDARADHAAYLARHGRHDDCVAAGLATSSALPTAA